MCLILRNRKACLRPWNKSRIRYKWMSVNGSSLCSPSQGTEVKRSKGKLVLVSNAKSKIASGKYCGASHGIHVHATLKSAMMSRWYHCRLFKVRCYGFLRSGGWEEPPITKEETWERIEFIIPRGKKHPVPISQK